MSFNFKIQEAVREKIYPKIALMAPSGGGKTYSSLRLATGMKEKLEEFTGEKWDIILANTEGARGRYYADEFKYKIIDITVPHHPDKYTALVEYAESLKNVILIIDSTTHEWEGKGGCLELHKQAGGRYQDWAKISPLHDRFINAMAEANIPIIATMRGKDQYVMTEVEQNGRKRTTVEKIGVGAKQRDGFEYEFTCTFLLDQKTNMAEPFKDNTHIFEDEIAILLTEEHGKKIIEWANSSNIEPNSDKKEIKEIINNIDKIAKEKASVVGKEKVFSLIQKHHTSANYNTINDINVAKKVLEELKSLK